MNHNPTYERGQLFTNLSNRALLGFDNLGLSIVSLFAVLGRLIKFSKKVKDNLVQANYKNLNETQLRLLNDNAHVSTIKTTENKSENGV